jgi:hypothetical protein
MKNVQSILLISMLGLILSGCAKKIEEANVEVDPVEAAVETGITVVSGLADEQAGSAFAKSNKSTPNIWRALLGEQAYAAACSRAVFASCNAGVKQVTYDTCQVTGYPLDISGQVSLAYSDAGCGLSNTNDSVTRTYDITISGPRGGSIAHDSASAADYRGSSYGGGGRLSKTASGWQIEVLGRHSVLSFRSKTLFNISARTLTPIQVSGSLSRAGRTVTSGQLEINHNIAKFTAVFTANNLQYSNNCCHPIGGSLSVNYSGSKTGSATVTFNSCGSATVDQGGQQQQIQLSYCE